MVLLKRKIQFHFAGGFVPFARKVRLCEDRLYCIVKFLPLSFVSIFEGTDDTIYPDRATRPVHVLNYKQLISDSSNRLYILD